MSTRNIMAAVTKTLHAYERLIASKNPSALMDEWLIDRVCFHPCRICEAMEEPCISCPIFSESGRCVRGNNGDIYGSKEQLRLAFVLYAGPDLAGKNRRIKDVAKARYRELLRRLRKNGYVYR